MNQYLMRINGKLTRDAMGRKAMKETRLRLTPSEFGVLWTYFETLGTHDEIQSFVDQFGYTAHFTPRLFLMANSIELIEEYEPDFRPRYENGKLTVDRLFPIWEKSVTRGDQKLLGALL